MDNCVGKNITINVVLEIQNSAIEKMLRCVLQPEYNIVTVANGSNNICNLVGRVGIIICEYRDVVGKSEKPIAYTGLINTWPKLVVGETLGSDEELNLLKAGFAGYLALSQQLPYFQKAINEIIGNGLWYSREVLCKACRCSQPVAKKLSSIAKYLTPREKMVADAVCVGLRNKAIACELSISEKTVKLHLSRIYQKLSITGRSELIVLGFNNQAVVASAQNCA